MRWISHPLLGCVAALALGCEPELPPLPANPTPPAPTVDDAAKPDPPPAPSLAAANEAALAVELPAFEDWPPGTMAPGITRLANCKAYDAWVRDGMTNVLLRKAFEPRFGEPFGPELEVMPILGARNWAIDGPRFYFQTGQGTIRLDAETNEKLPVSMDGDDGAIFAAHAGNLLVGQITIRRSAPHVRYGANPQMKPLVAEGDGWTVSEIRVRSIDAPRPGPVARWALAGATLRTHEHDGDRYFLTLTEGRVDRDLAQAAANLAGRDAAFEHVRTALSGFAVRTTAEMRPGLERLQGSTLKHLPVACSDVFVTTDTHIRGPEILAVYRYDAAHERFEPVTAIAATGVIADVAGDRLYVLRRLRGARRGDIIERPASQLEVYEIGPRATLLTTAQVDGVPVALRAGPKSATIATTRWPNTPVLVFGVDDLDVSEPREHPPNTSLGVVVGEPAGDVWSTGLLTRYDRIFAVGSRVVGAKLEGGRLRFDLLDAGEAVVTSVQTDPAISVLDWGMQDPAVSDGALVVLVKSVVEGGAPPNLVMVRLAQNALTIETRAIDDLLVGTIANDEYVYLTSKTHASIGLDGATPDSAVPW